MTSPRASRSRCARPPWRSTRTGGDRGGRAAPGPSLYAHNATMPLVRPRTRSCPSRGRPSIRLGPGYRFHTEVARCRPSGSGRRLGRATSYLGETATRRSRRRTSRRLAAAVRATGIRRVTGRIRGDESAFDGRRGAPGWKPYFVGGESPPLSALVVDRAHGWPALSPPLLAARALREALVARGRRRRGPARARAGAAAGRDARRRPLAAARVDRPRDEPRQRQLHRGDAPQAPRDARRRRGHDRPRRERSCSPRCAPPGIPIAACGSSTARACRRSTG